MIIQDLIKYYNEHINTPGTNNVNMLESQNSLLEYGFDNIEIKAFIDLDEEGKFLGIIPASSGKEKAYYKLPKQVKRSGKSYRPNLLYDRIGYVLGLDSKGVSTETITKHNNFVNRHIEYFTDLASENQDIKAVLSFLQSFDITNQEHLQQIPKESIKSDGFYSFRVNGRFIFEDIEIQKYVLNKIKQEDITNKKREFCLDTEKEDAVARLHPSISINGKEVNLVSFNKKIYASYGFSSAGSKGDQGYNAPISIFGADAYTKVLNYFIGDSNHHSRIGRTTYIYWVDYDNNYDNNHNQNENKINITDENLWNKILSKELFKDEDSTINGNTVGYETLTTEQANQIIKNVLSGKNIDNVTQGYTYHIAEIETNEKRCVLKSYKVGKIENLFENVNKHYERMALISKNTTQQNDTTIHISPYQLLNTINLEHFNDKNKSRKKDNQYAIRANDYDSLVTAIIEDKPYNPVFCSRILNNIKKESGNNKITFEKVSFLKAFLLKNTDINVEGISMGLNENNKNSPYLLGRIFALFEDIQRKANNPQKTIVDKYFDAIMSTPQLIFPELVELNNYYFSKVKEDKNAKDLQQRIGRIISELSDIPEEFDTTDKCEFILGYYQEKNKPSNNNDNTKIEENNETS